MRAFTGNGIAGRVWTGAGGNEMQFSEGSGHARILDREYRGLDPAPED